MSETIHDRRATHRALLLMFASAMMFGAMAFAAKLASTRLSGPQVAMVRFTVGLLPPLVIARYRRAALKFQRLDLLLYRGFFGGVAVLFYFMAIAHIHVGVATLLNYSAPLFSGIFSVLFIGEKISPKVLIAVPVALTGIYLVVRANAHPGDILGFGRWELVGLASAFCSGIAVTAMRVARRGENSWSVYTRLCLFGVLVTAPFGIATWQQPRGDEWYSLAATSLLAIGAQLCLTFSLRWIDAMTGGVISQLAVLVSMVLGTWLLNEQITPMAALGATLTIGGVCGVVYVTSWAKAVPAPAPES
ncbi:MAG TPA: DMT family transporter [Thermoanaerobaculia bacterium]|nr:DMT family transporter [Thermoanaerobaculia bacterium]